MKWIKTFENFSDNDIDEDLFINYLQYVTDIHDLFKIKDSSFLKKAHFLSLNRGITSENFEEGYFYISSGPFDSNSKHYRDRYSKFYVTILKKSYGDYPESRSEYSFKTEYPRLYSDLESYKSQMRKLHNQNQFEFRDYMYIYLMRGSEFNFYKIEIQFELRRLEYEETPDYQAKRMLKQLNLNDEEKKKLKEIGYNLDESIKVRNITEEDVIKTIKGGGKVFATIIKDFPNNDPKEPLTPVSIDGDGLVTVSYDGKEYEVDIKNIEKIDIPVINESIDVDWSKPSKEIEKSVLNEINRIFKKTKSDIWRSSFSNKDLEWSDTPSEDYEYKDGKLVKVGEKKVFLRFSNSIREELNILEEIEEIYDDLSEKFMGIIDMLNFDASFELAWDYGPKFKEVEYVDFGVTFNFEKLDMPSYGKSLQNISSLIGNENITYWTNSDKKLTVYFRHKK